MEKDRIIRAWKDPEFRASLSEQERASLPGHPSEEALSELREVELAQVAGGRYRLTGPRECAER
jgi:mersacidin/lichenicidin family type 2 lantibiotic